MGAVIEEVGAGVRVTVNFDAPPVVRRFIEDPTFVTGYFGPLGCAKTSAGAMKAWAYSQAYPGARGVVIRSTWPSLQDTTQRTFFEWLPPGTACTYERTRKVAWIPTSGARAEVLFRGLDDPDDVQKVLSLDVAWAWIDEPQGGPALKPDGTIIVEPGISRALFDALLGRLGRQAGGYEPMLWLTGNPPPPSHWIGEVFGYDPGASGHDEPRNLDAEAHLYLGDQETNRAHLPEDYYERLERRYGTGTPMARRYLHGEWIEFATEKPFHRAWMRFWGTEDEPLPPIGDMTIEAAIDPAISKRDTAAYSAFVVAGQVRRGVNRGRLYVLHAEKAHLSTYEQVDRMLKLTVEHKIRTWRIEDVAYQKALGDVLDHESRERGVPVHVELVKPDGDKLRRANAWSPLVESGTVLFGPGQKTLIDDLLAVPLDPRAWDLPDAAGLCVRGFPVMDAERSRIPGAELSTPRLAQSYAVRPLATERARPTQLPLRSSPRTAAAAAPLRARGYAAGQRRVEPPLRGVTGRR